MIAFQANILLSNSYIDQEDPTGALTIEAFSVNGLIGVVHLAKGTGDNDDAYDISKAFGYEPIIRFTVIPKTSTLRVSALSFDETAGMTFENANATFHGAAAAVACFAAAVQPVYQLAALVGTSTRLRRKFHIDLFFTQRNQVSFLHIQENGLPLSPVTPPGRLPRNGNSEQLQRRGRTK